MFAIFGKQPRKIPEKYLAKFIRTCRCGNWRQGDFIGHHGMGWGIAWLNESNKIKVHRSLRPIWKSNWQQLLELESRCIILHARFCPPWGISLDDVHPITINNKVYLFHNGMIGQDSIPIPNDRYLRGIYQRTAMDTRKYLTALLDRISMSEFRSVNINAGLNDILPKFRLIPSANSFILTENGFSIVEYMKQYPIIKRQTYVLNMKKINELSYCVSVIPLDTGFSKIPNHSVIHYDFSKNNLEFTSLQWE